MRFEPRNINDSLKISKFITEDLYGKPFKPNWVAAVVFLNSNPSNFRRLLQMLFLRYTAGNLQVT